jgi:serine/threonine-protein kinase HipA
MATRKVTHLNIWMNGLLVGQWGKKAGVEELSYAQSWVESEQGRPLSLSLPFTPGNQKIRGDSVKFYFDNLLPDSDGIRNRLAVKFGTNSAAPFDLLVELGRDCVGAIQLLKPDEEPADIYQISAKSVSDSEIAEILRNAVLSDGLFNKGNDDFRISLAGAQEKTAFLWHNEQWCVPLGATPTTHIFKLPLGLAGK